MAQAKRGTALFDVLHEGTTVPDEKLKVPTWWSRGDASSGQPKAKPRGERAIKPRPDYLRFQTPPLIEDVVIVGPVSLELYVSTDAPDTDFMAKLVDVYPDGYEALILDSPIRLRYRNGRRPQDVKMMKPGKIEKVEIDLWNTANTFEKGHRIAVHISSSNYPRFELNANNGEAPGSESLEPRIANNTIHHDASHPSALVLPVLAE